MELARSKRFDRLRMVALWGIAIVSLRVLLTILYEYQWYFPADFQNSFFLSGRRATFAGWYSWAFYTHVIASPPALILATALWLTKGRGRLAKPHRIAGRAQAVIVLVLIVPSGMAMAIRAYAGPVAAVGFFALSSATGLTLLAAVRAALRRDFGSHERWATRCLILLWSPLLLRLFAGLMIVTGLESDWTYRLNAWLSWLIPLALFEIGTGTRRNNSSSENRRADSSLADDHRDLPLVSGSALQ